MAPELAVKQEIESTVPDVEMLARIASEWLTFPRLQQEMLSSDALDPVVVSATGQDVGAVVGALLSPNRDPEEVERARYALMRALSGHPEMVKFYFHVDEDADAEPIALQAMLHARDDIFAHWAEFLEGMQRVGTTVCQICLDGSPVGTGFLITDRHVLTAHHCIAPLVEGGSARPGSARKLEVVFDVIAYPGKSSGAFRSTFSVAKDWLTFGSRNDEREGSAKEPLDEVEYDRLDFAVICLDQSAGFTAPKLQKGSPRNWIDIRDLAAAPQPQAQMLIAHHPAGADLRISVGLFDRHSRCERRIRYLTPTVVGSSGAPCFNINWKLYAIHNAGYSAARINQGVPLFHIVKAIGGIEALKTAQATERRVLPILTSSGDPILGRQEVAEHVDEILKGMKREIALVITSSPQGGKTFTAELIRSMVIERGHSAFLLDAEKFAADSPEVFAHRLVNEISGEPQVTQPASPDSRQRARWVTRSLSEWTRKQVVREFHTEATREGENIGETTPPTHRTLWIILDRCDAVKFSQETHDLLVALIADQDLDSELPLHFLLIGYDGALGAVPVDRVARFSLDLFSVAAVLPFMQYVLASLSIAEDPDLTLDSASTWVATAKGFGITEIPKVVAGLKEWKRQRHDKLRKERAEDQPL